MCFTGRWANGFWKWEPQNRKTREALKGPDGWEICIPGPHESSYWLAWEKHALKPPYQCALIFRTSQQATARRLSRNLTIPRRKKYSVERAEDSQALEASLDFNFELFQQLWRFDPLLLGDWRWGLQCTSSWEKGRFDMNGWVACLSVSLSAVPSRGDGGGLMMVMKTL